MADKKIKWLMYTVLVGLIPVLLRMLIWVISQNPNMEMLNAADFIVFGLILHISNINEIEHFNESEKAWKTFQIGTSIAFITFYSVLFASYLLGESNPGLVKSEYLKYIAMSLSIASFIMSFSVYNRISNITGGMTK